MDEMESYTRTPGPLVPPTSAAGQEREPKKHVVGSFLEHPISKRDGNRESTEQRQTRSSVGSPLFAQTEVFGQAFC
ncbi:hypothetical protein VTI28DRAFT_8516 [Corynascus sepedonium]